MPLAVLTKSAPSTVISLLNERIPPKEICVTSNSVNVVPRLVRLVGPPRLCEFCFRGLNDRRLSADHNLFAEGLDLQLHVGGCELANGQNDPGLRVVAEST